MRASSRIDILAVVVLLYAAACALPATLWFNPGQVQVGDTVLPHPPAVGFSRVIKRPTVMSYQVVIRDIQTGANVCDPRSNPFTYLPTAKLPEAIDLVWWTGGDERCWPRTPGVYVMETCWTVVAPLWGLAPRKVVCRESNPFTVFQGVNS